MIKLLKEELESTFKKAQVDILEKNKLVVTAPNDVVLSILSFLKSKGYDHLVLISCVDWIEVGELELVYIVSSYLRKNNEYTDSEKLNIILKTRILRENPKFKTIIPIFRNAEPYERELHELFGIDFQGNKRLIPLFLERDYKIPPFRKDFDTRKYVKEVFDKVPFIKEKKNERA